MNEQTDFERVVADQLASAGVGMPPESAIEDTIARAGGSRQDPEWLALIKESPMRTNNHLAVGSPTVRVMAIMAATMLLALALAAAGAGAKQMLAADGVIVVARDGSGDYTTIGEAVAAADDGDEITVRPDTYVEAIVIEKNIAVRGDGPVEEVVVMAPEDGPEWDTQFSFLGEQPYAIVLSGSDATVSGLTLRGVASSLFADGGAPSIEEMLFDQAGVLSFSTGSAAPGAVIVTGGSTASIQDSEFRDAGGVQVFESAAPIIEHNRFHDGPAIYGDYGDGTIIRANVLDGPCRSAIRFGSPAVALVEDNEIAGRSSGIDSPYDAIVGSIIQGNTVSSATSVAISADSAERVADNTLSGNRTGIAWSGKEGLIEGNVVSDGDIGIVIGSGAPVLRDNVVEGIEGRAIRIGGISSPVLSGNTSCGNGENLSVSENATPQDDGTNEFCEDAPAE
jgi:F-box protein 11